jgi:hypothetical protein
MLASQVRGNSQAESYSHPHAIDCSSWRALELCQRRRTADDRPLSVIPPNARACSPLIHFAIF